jgi:hypothetical protein
MLVLINLNIYYCGMTDESSILYIGQSDFQARNAKLQLIVDNYPTISHA